MCTWDREKRVENIGYSHMDKVPMCLTTGILEQGGGGYGLSLESFSFRAMEEEMQFMWKLEKCRRLGVGNTTQLREGSSVCGEKEVWDGRQFVDHIPDPETTVGALFLPGGDYSSRVPRLPSTTGSVLSQMPLSQLRMRWAVSI